ncbi:MAG TPA: hypothetical protein VLE95_07085 [Chlamydiales bacterium]|nr:hypothetical protein [Chlamydiales bacterium]
MNRLNPFNFFNTRPIPKNYEDPPLKNNDKYSNFEMVDNEYDELRAVNNDKYGKFQLVIVNPDAEKE